MLIAGEPSGDVLGAELVRALRVTEPLSQLPGFPEFFGAGGPAMAAAGVQLEIDLTRHAIFGISDLLTKYMEFRRMFKRLIRLAIDRAPDAIILIDFSGFNLRLARAIKRYARSRRRTFGNWDPRLIYYVSPQVWASREGRVRHIAANVDLLLSIFPFEKEWYRSRTPHLPVEFVGHPILDRYSGMAPSAATPTETSVKPLLLVLPGSRKRELQAHLPVMIDAALKIQSKQPVRIRVVLPNPELVRLALQTIQPADDLEVQSGTLAQSLAESHVALAASGTVTLECAYFRVPTVVLYRTSRLTYEIGRRIVNVRHIAMPNIIAGEAIYPELIQDQVTPDGLANAALELFNNSVRRNAIQTKLSHVMEKLGGPGASRRAARAVVSILEDEERWDRT